MAADKAPAAHHRDLRDPYDMAIEITRLSGDHNVLSSKVEMGLSNMSSTLNAQGGQLMALNENLAHVLEKLQALREHGSGLERLGDLIRDATQEQKSWRQSHEVANQRVADQVHFWRGALFVGAALVSVVLGVVIYVYQSDKAEITKRVDANSAFIRELQLRPR